MVTSGHARIFMYSRKRGYTIHRHTQGRGRILYTLVQYRLLYRKKCVAKGGKPHFLNINDNCSTERCPPGTKVKLMGGYFAKENRCEVTAVVESVEEFDAQHQMNLDPLFLDAYRTQMKTLMAEEGHDGGSGNWERPLCVRINLGTYVHPFLQWLLFLSHFCRIFSKRRKVQLLHLFPTRT